MRRWVTALALILGVAACAVFQNHGPIVPDWSFADQAGASTENQHGYLARLDAGVATD
jgi:hypothetical protein